MRREIVNDISQPRVGRSRWAIGLVVFALAVMVVSILGMFGFLPEGVF